MSESQTNEGGTLNEITAAAELARFFDEPKEEAKADEAPVVEAQPEPENVEVEAEQSEEAPQTFTVKIDGKEVEVSLDELKNGYQRQQDYTKKTMEVSESRKAAEAEISQARAEREQYAQALHQQQIILQSAMQEQQQIDWNKLLESDPMEYLKQQHLYQQRQAALNQMTAEAQRIEQIQQAEFAERAKLVLSEQQDKLLAKLPEWKDGEKAKAEKSALKSYLAENGFNNDEISALADHRSVVVARKAMLYDQMMSKAQAAAKKVDNLPSKVERAGAKSNSNALDRRNAAYQRLSKTGRVDDAAAVFASILD